jgi:signal transduction histidine kinase/CheY-like chemotaxis protein
MYKRHDPPLVLVADDQMPTAIMLERVFEYEGYQVQSVYDGIAAIDTARRLYPDLILLDINMPGLNGFEVLRQLRESQDTASIPTIIITAMTDLSDIVHGLNLGADDYLRKPFHPQELLARAESKMKARQLEEDLQRRSKELEALLRASEELNQHIEVHELLDFILYLVDDLLPGKVTALYYLDDNMTIVDSRTNNTVPGLILDGPAIVQAVYAHESATVWPDDEPIVPEFPAGMGVILQHMSKRMGVLLVLNDEIYDDNHLRLFHGISRQASLALNNAQLYVIQANYALHLEDMVAERTAELESAQEMLVRSEKLASVGRLAASIAHEINNPLLPIQINLENMLEDVKNGHSIEGEDIERTLESVDRIKYIVDRLLGFTRNRQSGSDSFEWVNLNKIIDDVTTLNRKFFSKEGINIVTDLSPIPDVMGNPYQLEHVFMNLTLNAKDAMEKGGTLRINSQVNNGKIQIDFEDDGCGIPEKLVNQIFEPFVSTKENGTGLGLFISYTIIEKHKATISVQSETGQGTRFVLVFPVP